LKGQHYYAASPTVQSCDTNLMTLQMDQRAKQWVQKI